MEAVAASRCGHDHHTELAQHRIVAELIFYSTFTGYVDNIAAAGICRRWGMLQRNSTTFAQWSFVAARLGKVQAVGIRTF
jgi:hypothetical protein